MAIGSIFDKNVFNQDSFNKIYNKEEGYFYENKTASLNEKLQVWKNIIRDYIACW